MLQNSFITPTYGHSVWPRMTIFCVITYMGLVCFTGSAMPLHFPFSALTRLDGQPEGIWPVNSRVWVCWWCQFDWSFARLIDPVVTTTSIILSSNKIHNGDILVSANPGPPGKWPLKWKERERGVHHRSWGLPVGPHNSIKALKENLVNYRR